MPSINDFIARGRVSDVREGMVIFHPTNTNYELHLKVAGGKYDGPRDTLINAHLHVAARKVWTVSSGGLFVTPLFGPPRIIQGRVRHIEDRSLVLHAGAPFTVELPEAETAYDLQPGSIGVNTLVNVTVFPGARIEFARQPAAANG